MSAGLGVDADLLEAGFDESFALLFIAALVQGFGVFEELEHAFNSLVGFFEVMAVRVVEFGVDGFQLGLDVFHFGGELVSRPARVTDEIDDLVLLFHEFLPVSA